MPKLVNTEKLNDYLYLGVQIGAGVKGTGYSTLTGKKTNIGRGVWTARIKFPKQAVVFRSTGVKYSPDNEANKAEATKKAFDIFTQFSEKASRGQDYAHINYISNLAETYLKYMDESARLNEEALAKGETPSRMILGGKSFWTEAKRKQQSAYWTNYLKDFIEQLPKQHKRDAGAVIENLDPRDLDKLDEFIISINPRLAIETRLKIITEFRHFLHWCYDRRLIDSIHNIKRPQRGGTKGARQRMRKEITPDMYLEMVKYTRERYTGENIPKSEKDYAYIFHLWFLIMANCGIRVPTSGTEHTMVRWEHLKKRTFKGKPQWTLERPSEKGHTYEAIILEPAYEYWTALETFYKNLGMDTKKGYVFAHPHNEYKKDETLRLEKGTPIRSFKSRWEKMCSDLGYNESGTMDNKVSQSERVSPTSLRAWFITQRLYSSDDIKIELLARVTGTSIGQIEARYLRLDMARSYEYLSAGAYDSKGKEAVYEDGYYVGRK